MLCPSHMFTDFIPNLKHGSQAMLLALVQTKNPAFLGSGILKHCCH